MNHWEEPCEANDYLAGHADRMLESYRRWTGRDFMSATAPPAERARQLYHAPFALVSHNTAPDPIFNYANLTAQRLFAMDWKQFTALPSRLSAEPVHRDERARLMAEVARSGYIDDYEGVRIAASGRRFRIMQTTIWNLLDDEGRMIGQAAVYSHWQDEPDHASNEA